MIVMLGLVGKLRNAVQIKRRIGAAAFRLSSMRP
jgi:hypothetical protein